MSRRRLISPEFFTHGALFDAEHASGLPLRLAFAGLWTVADRRGYFRWRPRELKLAVLPYDSVDFADVLAALESAGFIQCYVVENKEYGRIPTFTEWQSFHPNEKPSDVPEPTNGCREPAKIRRSNAALTTVVTTALSTTTALTPIAPRKAADGDFEEAFQHYPKRIGGNPKSKAAKAWAARRAAGVEPLVLGAGMRRYAAFVKATGKDGTQYVMQAATFFGPDEHYLEPWTVPAIVVTPPRFRPGPTVTEIADQRHQQQVALEEAYQAAAHRAGAQWAKDHPDEFAPIKEQVERSYRGVPALFAAGAIRGELTTRCAKAAKFADFETWQATRRPTQTSVSA